MSNPSSNKSFRLHNSEKWCSTSNLDTSSVAEAGNSTSKEAIVTYTPLHLSMVFSCKRLMEVFCVFEVWKTYAIAMTCPPFRPT